MNNRYLFAAAISFILITGCSPSIVGLTSEHPELRRQAETLDASAKGSDDSLKAFFELWSKTPMAPTDDTVYHTEASQLIDEFFNPAHSIITAAPAEADQKPYTTISDEVTIIVSDSLGMTLPLKKHEVKHIQKIRTSYVPKQQKLLYFSDIHRQMLETYVGHRWMKGGGNPLDLVKGEKKFRRLNALCDVHLIGDPGPLFDHEFSAGRLAPKFIWFDSLTPRAVMIAADGNDLLRIEARKYAGTWHLEKARFNDAPENPFVRNARVLIKGHSLDEVKKMCLQWHEGDKPDSIKVTTYGVCAITTHNRDLSIWVSPTLFPTYSSYLKVNFLPTTNGIIASVAKWDYYPSGSEGLFNTYLNDRTPIFALRSPDEVESDVAASFRNNYQLLQTIFPMGERITE